MRYIWSRIGLLMWPIKCEVERKRGENVLAVSKEFTTENVCTVSTLFRIENSVEGEVLGGGWEWKWGYTMSSVMSMLSVICCSRPGNQKYTVD